MDTLNTILESDVYEELFLTSFQKMLEKFVAEFDDMSQMQAIRQAKELLDTFNE
jgi:hypothetical protein